MRKEILLLALPLVLSACAVAMSSNRTVSKGDPAIIQQGCDRMLVESTFGPPNMTASVGQDETKVIYKIDPRASTEGGRDAAVAGHVVADVLTLGLWEVVGTPIELAAQDEFVTYVIVYDKANKVKSVETYK